MNWYLRKPMPAAELKSWLRWHLPPILHVLPHKQIKQLYLCLPCTLRPWHFIFICHLSLSLPSHTSSLTASRAVIYMQILVRKRRRRNAFLLLKNKQPHNLAGVPPSDWTWPSETQACCLQSWVEGWQGQWAHSSGCWQERARLTLEEVQDKINPNCTYTHKWTCWTSSLWQENTACFIHSISIYLNAHFNKIITGLL